MKVIRKNLICRVGMDCSGGLDEGPLFIEELGNLDSEIANAVCEQLGLDPEEIHRKTSSIKKITDTRRIYPRKISIAGGAYLAEKVLKLRLRVIIDECKLVDDRAVKNSKRSDGSHGSDELDDDSDAE